MGPDEADQPPGDERRGDDDLDEREHGGDPACHLHLDNERGY